jgi:SAM-dependent methyltransferase
MSVAEPAMMHLRWPLHGFENVSAIDSPNQSSHRRAVRTRFPVRYMRYWFARGILANLHARLRRPLRVLEVGIDRGQMLCFLGGPRIADDRFALPEMIAQWDGVDVQADPRMLRRYSYSTFQKADIEKTADFGEQRYDAVVLLHVLEHLAQPAAAMRRLLPVLVPGGLMLGGSPTMPASLGYFHEKHLRRKFADRMHDVTLHKHLSVISPSFIRRFARDHDLALEFLSGAFMIRASGFPLENYRWWMRTNMLWGALFPSLGGEVYFSLRAT